MIMIQIDTFYVDYPDENRDQENYEQSELS